MGLLKEADYASVNFGDYPTSVDYERIFYARRPILETAVKNFLANQSFQVDFKSFEKNNRLWLDDFAEFMAIKEHFGNQALQKWDDKKAVARDPKTLEKYRTLLAEQIQYFKVTQYFFFKQWGELKDYANQKGIKIIGDMPIYVAADSVEVWTKPELFQLDKNVIHFLSQGFQPISSVQRDNFGAIRFMIGKNIKNKAMLGGFTVLKKASRFMMYFVSIISKVSQIIGKWMEKPILLKMVVGSQAQAMIYSKRLKSN